MDDISGGKLSWTKKTEKNEKPLFSSQTAWPAAAA